MKLEFETPAIAQAVTQICKTIRAAGGRALLVGGCVRDALLGQPGKDVDLEVYGLEPERLTALLAQQFKINTVGKSFGVIKIHDLPLDISIPRRESKSGLGHKGFEIYSDPHLSPLEAARRRDFTINAIALDPLSGEIIDPFGGRNDLEKRLLRHTSDQFAEDPLRVLRGMQFAARFLLTPAAETVALCRQIEPEGLPRERLHDEWHKLIRRGVRPSLGLHFLHDTGWIRYYPELHALVGCPQDPVWHPEGNVWVHTLHCLDAFAAERTNQDDEDWIVGLAVLCHDLGKPATTRIDPDRIRSPGHEQAGEAPTRSFLERITNQEDLIRQVINLVVHHLRPIEAYRAQIGPAAVRRLARKVGNLERLVRVARADHYGRPPIPPDGFPAGTWLLAQAQALGVKQQAPQPLVLGRHLIQLGLKPGPHFGPVLDACFEAQLDGQFSTVEDGIAFAQTLLPS